MQTAGVTQDTLQLCLILLMVALAVCVIRVLMKRSHLLASDFNLDDLLVDDVTRKASPSKCVLLGSFVMGCWVIFYQTVTGHYDNTMFMGFLGIFAIPAVTRTIGTAIKDATAQKELKQEDVR